MGFATSRSVSAGGRGIRVPCSSGMVMTVGSMWLAFLGFLSILMGFPRWLVNDDLGMNWFSSGLYTGTPEGDLVFINRALGKVLALGYTFSDYIPWYAVAMLVTNFTSLLLLLFLCRKSYLLIASWIGLSSIFFLWLTQLPNFTATAVIAIGVGLGTLSSYFARAVSLSTALVGSLLILIGFLWRSDAIFISGIIALPTVVYSVYLRFRSGASFALPMILASSVLSLIAFAYWADTSCLARSPVECQEWSRFFEYDSIRGTFHGTPRGELLAFLSEQIGWVPETYWLFTNFAYFDSYIFDLDRLHMADSVTPNFFQFRGGSVTSHILEVISTFSFAIIPFFGFALILARTYLTNAHKRTMLFVFGCTATFWLLDVLLVSFIRLPSPIQVSSVVCLAIAGILIALWNLDDIDTNSMKLVKRRRRQLDRVIPTVGIALMLVPIFFSEQGWIRQRAEGSMLRDQLTAFQSRYSDFAGDSRVIAPGGAGALFDTNPYSPVDKAFKVPLISGWSAFSPLWEKRKALLGIDSDVYGDLMVSANSRTFTKDGAVLLLADYPTARITADFMRNQLGLPSVAPMPVSTELLPGVKLWKFIRTSNE